jgi:hypothetical protein
MANKRLINWADNNIKAECFSQFLDYGFSPEFLILGQEEVDMSELFLEFESDVEETLEEEAMRLKLDRKSFIEYTQDNDGLDEEDVKAYRKKAFEAAVLAAARKRRDSD